MLTTKITRIADAIRNKTGKTDKLLLDNMPNEILSIETGSQPILQDKSIEITENGTTNIVADSGYDGLNNVEVTTNIVGGTGGVEDLDDELSIYNELLMTQATALNEIETALSTEGGNKLGLNIYIQSDEPVVKNGVWFKTVESDCQNVLVLEDNLKLSPTEWSLFTTDTVTNNPDGLTAVGDVIYILGGSTSGSTGTTTMRLLNTKSGEVKQKLRPSSLNNIDFKSSVISIGTDIYFVAGYNAASDKIYKYNTIDNTCVQIATLPVKLVYPRCLSIDNIIYIVGGSFSGYGAGNSNMLYAFDTKQGTITSHELPIYGANNFVTNIGANIYIMGDGGTDKTSYKYNVISNTYTKITDIPISGSGTSVSIGDNIYLFSSENTTVYKYNPASNTYEISNDVTLLEYKAGSKIIAHNNVVYNIGGNYTNTIYKIPFIYDVNIPTNKNVVVFVQKENNKYETMLATPTVLIGTTRLLTLFDNVYYIDSKTGLANNVKRFYGNGKTWVNMDD